MSLAGPLLSATNSNLAIAKGLLDIPAGSDILPVGSTLKTTSSDPLILLTGGTHSIAAKTDTAMLQLAGRSTAIEAETVDLTQFFGSTGVVSLILGTDKPLQTGGVLLETSGATVSGQKALKIDTALLEASAPLLNLKATSSFTTSVDTIDLSFQAKVTSLGPLVALDASTLNVTSGALIRLAGGSFLSVTGDLLKLSNGSTLNINSLSDGFLVTATGGSVLKVTGALVNFDITGTGGNSIVVKNNVAPTKTLTVGGVSIPIALTNNATISQVSISGTPVKSTSLGSISYPNGGSLLKVDGTTARVAISGL